MTEFSDDGRVDLGGGFRIYARGLRGEAETGVRGHQRSGGDTEDPVVSALSAEAGIRIGPTATITELELVGSGLRGIGGQATEDGVVTLELPPASAGERQAVLIEEDGQYAWFIPEPGARTVDVPIEAAPGTRSLGSIASKVVRVVAAKLVGSAIGNVAQATVGAIDRARNPYVIRTWTPDDYREKDVQPFDVNKLSGPRPALLVVHGFIGSVHTTFHDFDREVVAEIHRAYQGRTFAFGHPTIAVSPDENARWFVNSIPKGTKLTLDILAHSRGGLVARELAQVINDPRVDVRRIVFVGSPNGGTPLADTDRPQGLLNVLTNLLSSVPGAEPAATAAGLLQDILFDNVLSELEGITAMRPDSDYLAGLNALPTHGLEMRSISAEFQPMLDAGIVKTNLDRLIDAYYGGARNDRVVPTIATHVTDGRFNIPPGHRLVLDSSRSVHHSSFWDNGRAVDQLVKWVRPEWDTDEISEGETDPLAEVSRPLDPVSLASAGASLWSFAESAGSAVQELLGGPLDKSARPRRGKGPAVVLIPGIMGSYLRSSDLGSLIWVDPRQLNRGHFSRLVLGKGHSDVITPAGVHRTYLPLVSRLASSRDVFIADFDWRLDIRESARRLAHMIRNDVLDADPDRRVHLVAHSMGGLVARSLAVVDNDVWRQAIVDRGGRLVMLGTPNKGSYAIPLTLSGHELMLKVLAAADFTNRTQDIVEVVATFPGVYQMLPAPDAGPADDEHGALFNLASWGPDSPVQGQLLDDARRFHEELAEVRDPDNLIYVSGYGSLTPYRLEIREPGRFGIGQFRAGDGRVAHELGKLDESVQTYFSPATHGGLVGDETIIGAVDELLTDGRTDALEVVPPPRRSGEPDPTALHMLSAEDFDPEPKSLGTTRGATSKRRVASFSREIDGALSAYLGGAVVDSALAQLKVKVVHASLEKTKYPVAVGHYKGVPPDGAERFLDQRLDYALLRRQQAGLYPGGAGTGTYIKAPQGCQPIGAIVLGLGDFGSLTRNNLREAMTAGALAMALQAYEQSEDSNSAEVGIASVLVGSPGRYGVTVAESVLALTEGVAGAILQLRRLEVDVTINELELIELYELTADKAAVAVRMLTENLSPELTTEIDIVAAATVERREGGRAGTASAADSGTPWVRMLIEIPDGTDPASPIIDVELSTLERGAQANRLSHQLNLGKVEAYAKEAIQHSRDASAVAQTLYELLFPYRTKIELDQSENLHLVLDWVLAQLPWELVAERDASGDVRPLALQAGMLRQLVSGDVTRERPLRPSRTSALVIGDPPTEAFARLPGAREEARSVAQALRRHNYEVTELVYDGTQRTSAWMEIQDALLARPYRVIHIAAHGVYDEKDHGVGSGVVIGPKPHHRLSTLDFRQMSTTPDLVFLNACHLGRLGSLFAAAEANGDEKQLADLANRYAQPAAMAASLARQLMKNGVRAVVVAGWAVSDVAAKDFADELYSRLLTGYRYGDAVRSARAAAYAADDGRSNTWGAYQCYGDPDFRLPTEARTIDRPWAPVSKTELVREIDNLSARASDARDQQHLKTVADRLKQRLSAAGVMADAPLVQEALGRAYGELGNYHQAVEAYQNAAEHPRAVIRLKSIEQLANFKVRHAVDLCRGTRPVDVEEIDRLLESAEQRLEDLIRVSGESAERSALLGSLYKKRAAIRPGDDRSRTDYLKTARNHYKRAWDISSRGQARQNSYHTLVWLQMNKIVSPRSTGGSDGKTAILGIRAQVKKSARETERGYWDIAEGADLALTEAILGRPKDRAKYLDEAEKKYTEAFKTRSSVRQRDSVIDHIRDLAAVVDGDLQLKLERLGTNLDAWTT